MDWRNSQISFAYANEADMLNVVLFGMTAKEWRDINSDKKGNIRDEASINQLLVLANLESYNAVLLAQGKSQQERMQLLRQLAGQQLKILNGTTLDALPKLEN